jgi:hypothetical protein
VRTISKPILAVAVLLLGVITSVILCLNLYLRSSGTQEQLRQVLSNAAGVPVTIQSSYALPIPPLGAIRLSGVKGVQEGRIPLFSADSITLRPDYEELLHGRLLIAGLVLNHPVVRLTLGEMPGTQRPDSVRATSFGSAATGSMPQKTIGITGIPSITPSGTIAPTEAPSAKQTTAAGKPTTASNIPLRHVTIKNGEFTLINERGLPVISASGIHLKGAHDAAGGWIGNLNSTQVVLSDRVIFKDLKTPVRLSESLDTISLETLTAILGEGKLAGNTTIDLSLGAPRYSLAVSLAGASLKQLLADASYGASSAEGTVAGELQLSGTAGEGSSIEGKGGLFAKDATIQPVDFLKQIGQILNVDELKLLRLSESKCLFHLAAGRVVIDDLFLRSENLVLSAKGPLKPTGELDLDSRLLFNDKLTGRLRGLLGSQLSPAPEPGYSQVSFHVSGSPMNPRTDLLERLTGIKIGGDLGGILQSLFGRPAKSLQSPPAPGSPR